MNNCYKYIQHGVQSGGRDDRDPIVKGGSQEDMMNRSINTTGSEKGWLLFFYSVPSKPVSSRMKIWRRLAKAGAVQLKGAVYILPHSEEHYEFSDGWSPR
jgi:hypothetical protein